MADVLDQIGQRRSNQREEVQAAMDPLLPEAPERTDAGGRPLDRNARAAVTALARALEVFDRPAARRAALRAHLADRIAVAAGSPVPGKSYPVVVAVR